MHALDDFAVAHRAAQGQFRDGKRLARGQEQVERVGL
jgi:hypothetical protein